VGISLDTAKAREKLLEFVKTHGVPWPQYFDGKVMENEIARKYAVRSIPATFLLDQSGKVVSTEARGPVLEAEVKRLLKL
jgi:thioredoxin-related protein